MPPFPSVVPNASAPPPRCRPPSASEYVGPQRTTRLHRRRRSRRRRDRAHPRREAHRGANAVELMGAAVRPASAPTSSMPSDTSSWSRTAPIKPPSATGATPSRCDQPQRGHLPRHPGRHARYADGDIVNIDIPPTRTAYTATPTRPSCRRRRPTRRDLVEGTHESLNRAIKAVAPGREMNVIGRAIESYAKRPGYGVVRDFTGHGVGEAFHSGLVDPAYDSTPGFDDASESGMVFTINPMLNLARTSGTSGTRLDDHRRRPMDRAFPAHLDARHRAGRRDPHPTPKSAAGGANGRGRGMSSTSTRGRHRHRRHRHQGRTWSTT